MMRFVNDGLSEHVQPNAITLMRLQLRRHAAYSVTPPVRVAAWIHSEPTAPRTVAIQAFWIVLVAKVRQPKAADVICEI
jgi:hypothetical protein